MSDVKYSLTTLLDDLLRVQNNSYEIVSALSNAVSSNAEVVEVKQANNDGTISKVKIPTFGSLTNQLKKHENDIKSLAGITSDTSIQLSDGSFRKILVSNLQQEAKDIQRLSVPTKFNSRENWFFESFLNPLLFVTFDLSGQVKYNTEKIEVARYILNIDSDAKLNTYNTFFKDRSNIEFQNFINTISTNNITFFKDLDTIDLPSRSLVYFGNFSVLNITDDIITTTTETSTSNTRVLKLNLDKLTFSDKNSQYLDTQSLKVGHSLLVNSNKNTRYEIYKIDSETNSVYVKLIEGFDSIQIGTDILSFYDINDDTVSCDINVGFNEYQVIFIKPIDPESKIAATNWSPGVAFFSNDLTIIDETGNESLLSTYYQEKVIDFGVMLYSMAKDKVTPSTFGIEPSAPTLDSTNFKVIPVNKHLTDNKFGDDIKKLQSDKLRLESEINELSKNIESKRLKILTTTYSSKQLEDVDRNDLNKTIETKKSASSLYASTINDINKLSLSQNFENKSVYKVRGFWPMPEPKQSENTRAQEVIQFHIQYRYLSKDGSSNQPVQIEFKDNDGTIRRGSDSPWLSYKTDLRSRVVDEATGISYWADEDVENADVVNINSLNLDIQQKEAVEFKIRSISEAGWPINPLYSEWSDVIRVDFPDDLESIDTVSQIIEDAKKESVRINLQTELNNVGLDKHLTSSFVQGQKYYAHNAVDIASGFLTPENNIISIYDKIVALESKVNELSALIANAKGNLILHIVSEDGTEIPVKSNQVIKLFAGNYVDGVSPLSVKKGVIISKTYFVKIENDAASNLEMYARKYGSRYSLIDSHFVGGTGYNSNDIDYNTTRRYDIVPIGLNNPDINDVNAYDFINNYSEQSSQVSSQFLNIRFKDIANKNDLYYYNYSGSDLMNLNNVVSNNLSDFEFTQKSSVMSGPISAIASGTTATDFIWKGGASLNVIAATAAYPYYASDNMVFMHINHPDLRIISQGPNPNETASEYSRNSIFSVIGENGYVPDGSPASLSTHKNKQTPLFKGLNELGQTGFSKIGFVENDQYLIGPYSCGSYLFLNIKDHDDIIVDGSDSISYKYIKFGPNESLKIPFTFQYRMTDYFGVGDSGIGNIAGEVSGSVTNLNYTKQLAFDIYFNKTERISFDVKVNARYRSTKLVSNDIPNRSFGNAIDQLNNTIQRTVPRTSRTANLFNR